jgi:tetratricopeptide (TPR) repeat protein
MKQKDVLIILIAGVILSFSGCMAIKGRFSKGHDYIQSANSLWSEGKTLEALIKASEGILIDPDFIQGKNFFYEKFDEGIGNMQKRIAELGTPTKSEAAEELSKIYDNLVALYTNMAKVKLPIEHPKGKWSWTTNIIDYTPQQVKARQLAFSLLMKEGREFVSGENIPSAENRFKNAINNYLVNPEQKDSVSTKVADELCTFAKALSQSTVIEKAIIANSAYSSALKFVKQHPVALAGVTQTAQHISKLYVLQGQSLIKKTDVESWISSLESFKSALKWDKGNEQATKLQTETTQRIAEYYYQAGLKAENAKKYDEAIASYQEVRKWISNYKDSMSRIYTLKLNGKMEEMAKNLNVTRAEFGKLQARVNSTSSVVDKSVDIMGKITYISDNTRSLNETMKTTSSTLKLFTVIPTVGTVTGMLARSIDLVQDPVGAVANKFTALEQPVIAPTKQVVEKTQGVVNKTKEVMGKTEGVIVSVEQFTLRYKDCIAKVAEEKNFQEAEKAVDEINKGLSSTNKTLAEINGSFEKVENETKKIGQLADPVTKITKGLNDVKKVVDKIQPIVDELNGALNHKFTLNLLVKKFTFSVRQILDGLPDEVKAIMGKFSDLAMGVLKPVLNKFNIDIPTIPGLDTLSKALDSMKGYYDAINNEYNKLSKTVGDYANFQNQVDSNLKKVEASLGCQAQVN